MSIPERLDEIDERVEALERVVNAQNLRLLELGKENARLRKVVNENVEVIDRLQRTVDDVLTKVIKRRGQ